MSTSSGKPSAGDFLVILCTNKEQLRQAYEVRIEVFHKEQGFSLESEVDEYDLISAHFILACKSDPKRGLGTIRFSPYPSAGSLNKVEGLPADTPLGPPLTEDQIATAFVKTGRMGKSEDLLQAGAKLGRLALLAELRGSGWGRLLVEQGEAWLANALRRAAANSKHSDAVSMCNIRLHSQMPVRAMYEKFGYKGEGEPFDEDGAPHMLYTKTLPL
ncbi:hypothetical protein K437DRAFT_276563 [Tilletiaria anomala UBC 951]|uniref:N-acetyltransferase domain-containing protein n=1 Tax=Tilletiaria anomala (strain ATCC 24038 / CBS 436.72 / UBC 951) TaxID=1037660 RepID=A0A066VAU8_TILAU|nr:uncharacterized protein K437DRAFT_276563 [Tilletiaria anomala UBC 951]KDN37413.1 hypothetical protein K437DRAFT_276563 [Tilletiaria anomala UBC 951]